jgi:peptidoglycan/LPS O-acetylase OafA/YrhL
MDGARGLAVLLVFFVHYDAIFAGYAAGSPWSQALSGFLGTIGHAGVELFFVLSGYLIYGIVLPRPIHYGRFLRRRAGRIYPTFLAVLGGYLILSLVFPARSHLPRDWGAAAECIAENVALLPGIVPKQPLIVVAWTLSYEAFFYLSLPVAVWVLGLRRWKPSARILFFLLVPATYLFCCERWDGPWVHPRLVAFLAGMLLYEALAWPVCKDRLAQLGDVSAVLALAAGLVFVYDVMAWPALAPFLDSPKRQAWCYAAGLSVACFFFFAHVLGRGGRLAVVLSWTPLRCLGAMSYSYYLLHGLTLNALAWALGHVLPPAAGSVAVFWAALPFALALTFLTATVLFVFVEKPLSFPAKRGSETAGPKPRPLAVPAVVESLERPPAKALALENPLS